MPKIALVGAGEVWRGHVAASDMVASVDWLAIPFSSKPGESAALMAALDQPDLDGVAVSVPVRDRFAVGKQVAHAGKHLLVEAPVAATRADVEELQHICAAAGTTLTVLASQRRRPLLDAVHSTIAAGKIGAPRFAHLTSLWHWSAEDAAETTESDFLLLYGPGLIDVAIWLMSEPGGYGSTLERVFARAISADEGETRIRYVSILLIFQGGAQVICEIGRSNTIAPQTGLRRLSVTGDKGSLQHDLRGSDVVIGTNGIRPLGDDSVAGAAAALAAWSPNAGDRDSGREHATIALRWTLAAIESLSTGQPVVARD